MFVDDHNLVKIRFRRFRFSRGVILDMVKVGFPATLMQLMIAFYVVFINRFMSHFGTIYVAAFGLGSRLESIATMPFIAISFSMLTITGMLYGAKRLDLLRSFIWYGLKLNIAIALFMGLIFFLIPEVMFRIFTSDPVLLGIASAYMRIDVFTFPLMAIGFGVSRIIQGLGDGFPGLIIVASRVIFLFVPLGSLFVYVFGWGYLSVAVAMVLSGIVSTVIALVWLQKKLFQCSAKSC
jgi:Na+-driven multidrug efflux pump